MNINLSRSLLPNSATALNLFSGFLSIIFASNNNFHLAALFIFIAAFFDLIDGLLARLTNSSSKFGVELDSLADVVSFGAAPSFLIYKSYLFQYDFIGILISSLILIFGAFRLARFNVQLENIKTKLDFNGLPIPVAAITLAAYILFYHNGLNIINPFSHLIIPSILLLTLLMVSKIKYNTLPKIKYLTTFGKISVAFISIVGLTLISITDGVAFFYMLWFHIFYGIFRYLYLLIFNNNDSSEVNFNEK